MSPPTLRERRSIWLWWRWLLRLALLAVGLFVASVLTAGRSRIIEWEPVQTSGFPPGPPRSVRALAPGPGGRSLFAATDAGIFRSRDGGELWQAVNQGMTTTSVYAIVAVNDHSILAGTEAGLFRSDEGESWRWVGQELGRVPVGALALSADGEALFAATGRGIFRSDDDGDSWQAINRGITTYAVQALVAGPEGVMFAATLDGIFCLEGEAMAWQPVNRGLSNRVVRALVAGRSSPSQPGCALLFAATGSGGVFRSDNGGLSWRPVNQGLANPFVWGLTQAADSPALFAGTNGGVFRSDDEGWSWQPAPDLRYSDLPTTLVAGRTHLVAEDGTIDLLRPGVDWRAWATYRHQTPVAHTIRGNRATLYAPAGAAMLLRAETNVSPLWRAPAFYLIKVLQARDWFDSLK